MKKLLTIITTVSLTAIAIFAGVLYFDKPQSVTSQVSQIQLFTTLSASSTVPNQTVKGELIKPATTVSCGSLKCPSVLGTGDSTVSATSTGGTHVTGATTTLLQLATHNTDFVAFDLIHNATSTTGTNTVAVSFEVANQANRDGIGLDWVGYNGIREAFVNEVQGGNLEYPSTIVLNTGTSTPLIYEWNITKNELEAPGFQTTRIVVRDVVARYMRINAQILNDDLATPSNASGTIRVQAVQQTPI